MNPIMDFMSIRQTITCFGVTVPLQDISEIAAGLFTVWWNVVRFKSKCKADFLTRWKRHRETALFFRFFILFRVPLQFTFPSFVWITQLCDGMCLFTGANYPPFIHVFSLDNAIRLVGNPEKILRANRWVALGLIFSPVPVRKSKIFIVGNFLQNGCINLYLAGIVIVIKN